MIRCDPASDEALKAAIVCLNQRALERQELYPFTLEEMEYLKNGVYALSSPLLGKPNLGAPKKIWPERR